MIKLKLPKEDVAFRSKGNKVLEWGAEEFSMLKSRLKNFRVCLDIGAHVGITTLRYTEHFETVHSFEPLHCDILTENTKHQKGVHTYNCAVSNEAGTIEIYPNPKSSGRGIIPDENTAELIKKKYTNPGAELADIKKVIVERVTIDQFNFKDVDLIKVDVEGHTLPVINGMIKTLTDNSPVLQIEMSRLPEFKKVNNHIHNILTKLDYVKFDIYNEDWFYYKNK